MDTQWRDLIKSFYDNLNANDGYHSVKDLCSFLLIEPAFTGKDGAIRYLADYRKVAECHREFHQRWRHLQNMESTARYDELEIGKVDEMITALSSVQD